MLCEQKPNRSEGGRQIPGREEQVQRLCKGGWSVVFRSFKMGRMAGEVSDVHKDQIT